MGLECPGPVSQNEAHIFFLSWDPAFIRHLLFIYHKSFIFIYPLGDVFVAARRLRQTKCRLVPRTTAPPPPARMCIGADNKDPSAD